VGRDSLGLSLPGVPVVALAPDWNDSFHRLCLIGSRVRRGPGLANTDTAPITTPAATSASGLRAIALGAATGILPITTAAITDAVVLPIISLDVCAPEPTRIRKPKRIIEPIAVAVEALTPQRRAGERWPLRP
jgi:hypothetical protein